MLHAKVGNRHLDDSSRPVQPIITMKAEEQHLDEPFSTTMSSLGHRMIQAAMMCRLRGDGPCDVDLDKVPIMLGKERTQFERVVEQENVHRPLHDKEIIANAANRNSVTADPASSKLCNNDNKKSRT